METSEGLDYISTKTNRIAHYSIEGRTKMAPKLHPNQERILTAIGAGLDALDMRDHLAIVGSFAKHLAGDPKSPGDIDVLIDSMLCRRYWEFAEILSQHGIRSLWDVPNRESLPWWNPWSQRVEHARAFYIDQRDVKHNALDICMLAADVQHIPRSQSWVVLPDRSKQCVNTRSEIDIGHNLLLAKLREEEDKLTLSAPKFSADVGLWYRLEM